MVTFQLFRGYETVDLLRLFKTCDGAMTRVEWARNSNGHVYKTDTREKLPISKKEVKAAALDAIDLFRASQERETA